MESDPAADKFAVNSPRFSIVMPALNAAETIGAAVRSALLQTMDSLEVIVVDDGSTDGTASVVERLQRGDSRVRLFRQPRGGAAAARNEALRHVRGELVAMLDADDLLLPEYLSRMGAGLDRSPGAGFAYTTEAWVMDDATGRIKRPGALSRPPRNLPKEPTELLKLLLRRNFVFVAATVRRSALEGIAGWRETLTPAEDYDLWLRLVAAGHPAVRVEGPLAVYRRWSGSHSTNLGKMLRSRAALYREVAESWEVDEDSRRIARRRVAQTERWIRRFDPERSRPSLRLGVSQVRARVREPRAWLDAVPREVEELLARTAEPDSALADGQGLARDPASVSLDREPDPERR